MNQGSNEEDPDSINSLSNSSGARLTKKLME